MKNKNNNKNNNKNKSYEAGESRVRNTLNFIAELKIRETLEAQKTDDVVYWEDMKTDSDGLARSMALGLVDPFDEEVAPGQIRLLYSKGAPRRVIVVEKDAGAEETWIVIPFSQLNHPGLDSEVRLEHGFGPGCRVLQGWNLYHVPQEFVARGFVEAVDEAALKDAKALVDCLMFGSGMQEIHGIPGFTERTGATRVANSYFPDVKKYIEREGGYWNRLIFGFED